MKNFLFTKNSDLLRQKVYEYWEVLKQWFVNTPERSLAQAYDAAKKIRNIEVEHFNNQIISAASVNETPNVMSYWQNVLSQNLTIIKLRLAEFQSSRALLEISNPVLLEKLQFIDEVIEKYQQQTLIISKVNQQSVSQPLKIDSEIYQNTSNVVNPAGNNQSIGFLPSSIGRTINRITTDFSPNAEADFIRNYHISQNRTRTSVRFLLLLIVIPLLTQRFSKEFLVSPIVERVRSQQLAAVFINSEMEEEAFKELKTFEEQLKFQTLLKKSPSLSPEEIESSVKEKAIEIAQEFRKKSKEAISNVFADLISLVAFAVVVANGKKEIAAIKSLIDELIFGLSDSAKAFVIILFTDIFVGFHSPHGWEVILEGLAEHLGLAPNTSLIFLFIATFPVILDTVVKYWIFRYLSRLSPSALATYKEMNE
ncbi:proton extrusion protein PcxA [Nostoc sp. FACHB-87]|uniref:proton extrusion protein PcxA n=1 Tax=Nostocaceae TaxID=1162 RepID=UPI0016840EBB|nr:MULTISPECIES: proton extrusion protein PcxA [Nostocaceae]MBD2455627.1 proton extrusion protein PcxA [Nostoc sp. FACHB-87]MBD2477258.1 proton extrusion protein PcxA [Anabaena sp. FACHB-83]